MQTQCEWFETELTTDEALVVIEPYFEALLEQFHDQGLTRITRVVLVVTDEEEDGMRDTPRHFAGCLESGDEILVAPELADLPPETIEGILAHELGHAADFLYPAWFYQGRGGMTMRNREDYSDKEWRRFLRSWKDRDDDRVEMSADQIAELVTGERIGYAGPCMLQTLGGGGARRPRGLR